MSPAVEAPPKPPLAGERSPGDIIDLCRALAERFAPRASTYDREARFPRENFEDLRAAGLPVLMVPRQFGGLGATFFTYTRAIERLAVGDASTALAFNMHNIAVGSLAGLELDSIEGRRGRATAAFRDWLFGEARRGKFFAAASSEPNAGPRLSAVRTNYRRTRRDDTDGFVLNGVKSFVSLSGFADYYLIAARPADPPASDPGSTPSVSYFAIEASNPAMRFDNVWDTMGMRATSSNNMYLEDCFVPADRLFLGIEGTALYHAIREPHWLAGGYNGVYLGLADAIFDFTTRCLREKKNPTTGEPLSNDRLIQHQVGRMSVALEAARAVTYDAARLVDAARGSPEANEAIHRAKYLVSELAPQLASDAMRLCGGRSIFRSQPLERYYRDARCGGLMPATSDECLVYVGKLNLGFDARSSAVSYW